MKCAILIFVLAVPQMLFSQQPYVPKENEELYGTWINTDYPGNILGFQQVIIDPVDLSYYYKVAERLPGISPYKHTIVEKWTDSEGSIWYKFELISDPDQQPTFYYDLARISESGTTLEFVEQQTYQGWPTEIDKNHANYRIYYRQQ